MKTVVVIVAYSFNKSTEWYDISLDSFRNYFPNHPLIVVENNLQPNDHPKATNVLINHGNRSHGGGIDFAVDWCRKNNYDIMVLIEPDCVVHGTQWYSSIVNAIKDGFWMAGIHLLNYGAIHPCSSAWKIDEIKYSFEVCDSRQDMLRVGYNQIVNLPNLYQTITSMKLNDFDSNYWLYTWDCGLKNWFECALLNKAKYCPATDFYHFWNSRKNLPESLPKEIQALLSPYWPKIKNQNTSNAQGIKLF